MHYKNIFIVFLTFTLINASCYHPASVRENPNCCPYTEDFYNKYYHDALNIYAIEIYRDSMHPERNIPEINRQGVLEVLGQLYAVYEGTGQAADTVFRMLEIKAVPVNTRYLSIKVATAALEIRALLNDQPSGNAAFDGIIQRYAFDTVRPAYGYPQFPWITLISSRDWNMIPVAGAFEDFSFIQNVDAMTQAYIIGGNRYILRTRDTSFTELDFSYGWGDCPAGCIHRRHWIFRVYPDCEAEFVRSYGDRLP